MPSGEKYFTVILQPVTVIDNEPKLFKFQTLLNKHNMAEKDA